MSETTSPHLALLHHVTDVVAAYISNNSLAATDLPKLISATHTTLRGLSVISGTLPRQETRDLTPAVPIKKSVTPDNIACIECGKTFTAIKRHLANAHQLSPEQYREKWSLPLSYPMVAPNYSKRRSRLARQHGLGRDRNRTAADA